MQTVVGIGIAADGLVNGCLLIDYGMFMTRLYLVRHGETVDNVNRIMQGQTQGMLTDNGREQAHVVAREMADKKDRCVCFQRLAACCGYVRDYRKASWLRCRYDQVIA